MISAVQKHSILKLCVALSFFFSSVTPSFYHVCKERADVPSVKLLGHLHFIHTDMTKGLPAGGMQHGKTCRSFILKKTRGIMRANIIDIAHATSTTRPDFNPQHKSCGISALLYCKSFVSSLLLSAVPGRKTSPFESFCFKTDCSPPYRSCLS